MTTLPHCCAILEGCSYGFGEIVDKDIINFNMKNEEEEIITAKRWEKEGLVERYFFINDFLRYFHDKYTWQRHETPAFYFYGYNTYIWDFLIQSMFIYIHKTKSAKYHVLIHRLYN